MEKTTYQLVIEELAESIKQHIATGGNESEGIQTVLDGISNDIIKALHE